MASLGVIGGTSGIGFFVRCPEARFRSPYEVAETNTIHKIMRE